MPCFIFVQEKFTFLREYGRQLPSMHQLDRPTCKSAGSWKKVDFYVNRQSSQHRSFERSNASSWKSLARNVAGSQTDCRLETEETLRRHQRGWKNPTHLLVSQTGSVSYLSTAGRFSRVRSPTARRIAYGHPTAWCGWHLSCGHSQDCSNSPPLAARFESIRGRLSMDWIVVLCQWIESLLLNRIYFRCCARWRCVCRNTSHLDEEWLIVVTGTVSMISSLVF